MGASPFDPELRAIARVLPRGGSGRRTVRVVRSLEPLTRPNRPRPGVELVPLDNTVIRVHRPATTIDDSIPGLVWVHGGGFVVGTARQDDHICRRFADDLGAVVAAVDYRRPPEHPYPAPLQDCYDALLWLAREPSVDRSRIAIAGASAGGGLAAGLALLARDRGEVEPVFQALAYPMLDDRTVQRSDIDERHLRLWNNKGNAFGWRCYLAAEPGAPDVPVYASPARCDDLSGVAPAWIGVGTLDLFHDEDLAYALRLRDAGVAAEVHIVPGAFHGFDGVRPKARISQEFRSSQLDALTRALSNKTD